jgi:hypothetical protein
MNKNQDIWLAKLPSHDHLGPWINLRHAAKLKTEGFHLYTMFIVIRSP